MSTSEDPNAWMAEQIFKKISGMGHQVYLYDEKGQRVYDPAKANRLFSDTAKMMVTLGYTKGKPAKPLVSFHTSDSTDPKLLMDIKQTLKQHNLYDHSFDTMPYGKTLEPKMFAHLNKQDMTESAWTGSTRTSRWKTGLTEVVIRHSERLMDDQSARRWCKVRDIFIHGPDGGRYRMPIRHIAGAKALAQHINQDGQAWDHQGQMIHQMINVVQQCRRLRNWLQLNLPDLVPVMDAMQAKIKHCLKHMSDPTHYETSMQAAEQMCESWEQAQQVESDQVPEAIKEAWHALRCETGHMDNSQEQDTDGQAPHDPWPEHRGLMEWFNQFGPLPAQDVIPETDSQEIAQAVDNTKSHDPREVLANLSNNITGWESEFETNPKKVLDQITKTLEKIKRVR